MYCKGHFRKVDIEVVLLVYTCTMEVFLAELPLLSKAGKNFCFDKIPASFVLQGQILT